MRIQMQPEVKEFMNAHEQAIITVRSDHECVGANCSEAFTYPVISFKVPEMGVVETYDIFEIDGITVFFEKKLETVPEVTLVKEHHFLKDRIRVEGFPTPPPITHMKL
jgi:hypothetical protein